MSLYNYYGHSTSSDRISQDSYVPKNLLAINNNLSGKSLDEEDEEELFLMEGDGDSLQDLLLEDDANDNLERQLYAKEVEELTTSDRNEQDAKEIYIRLYENMIRQQDAELRATVAYLLPMFEQIQALGRDEKSDYVRIKDNSSLLSFTYSTTDNGQKQKELAVLTFASIERALRILGDETNTSHLKADEQWMMTLRELLVSSTNSSSFSTNGLTFPELAQCYRGVVNGMQTLQMLPSSNIYVGNSALARSAQKVQEIRNQTTNRVLSMIRSFGVDNTCSSDHNNSNSIAISEMRTILTAKDQQFAQLIMAHQDDMNELADQMKQMNFRYKRRSYAIHLFWIFCCMVSTVYVSRRPVDNPIHHDNETISVHSIWKDLLNPKQPVTSRDILTEFYKNSTTRLIMEQLTSVSCPSPMIDNVDHNKPQSSIPAWDSRSQAALLLAAKRKLIKTSRNLQRNNSDTNHSSFSTTSVTNETATLLKQTQRGLSRKVLSTAKYVVAATIGGIVASSGLFHFLLDFFRTFHF